MNDARLGQTAHPLARNGANQPEYFRRLDKNKFALNDIRIFVEKNVGFVYGLM